MRFTFLTIVSAVLFFVSVGVGQRPDQKTPGYHRLNPVDETEKWQYPYEVSAERKQKLLDALDKFKEPVPIDDLINKLGSPDRIEDLKTRTKPLSHFESGFMAGNKDKFSYRCVWFARKASKLPGLGDSWLAAYVDNDEKTVSAMHHNWLK